MKNTFGNAVSVTLFGESHGDMIGAVLDGIAPGIPIDENAINHRLTLRRPIGKISTARQESDPYTLVSGVFNGKTTGAPLTVLIPNQNQNSRDYRELQRTPRPSHADYTAGIKYHGFEDYRGGGHFSGRLTAPLVAIGAILQSALSEKGILIGTHIKRCAGIDDIPFSDYCADVEALNQKPFAVLDETKAQKMISAIEHAASEGDSVGGILETVILGIPAGVGEPWFDSVESMLSHALFSIGGIKGIEFGSGFMLADMKGSEANDPFTFSESGVRTLTNHAGGINGGITNGMPVLFSVAVRPTPSIFRTQKTVDLETGENTALSLKGRHDPCIVHRVRAVVDAITAIVVADLLTQRYGTDYLAPNHHKETLT
ncbi:MAG: chorismate synthase [Clostridia bacterium]|nr:chorismate synthase [Clostridia bacterium]